MENSSSSTALTLSRPPLPPTSGNASLNKEVVPSSDTERKSSENEQQRVTRGREIDPNMDPKKLRRVLASRQYSQKYRMKQLHYIMHLETEVKALQAEVAIAAPRIKYVDRQNNLLRVENGRMKQKLTSFSGELMFKEAQYDELKKERDVLKQVYMANYELMMPPGHFKPTNPSGNYQFININPDHQSGVSP
ncbi:hypothetical protein Tsubulata_000462 [Turnera subulata]|uniref:BZIP domain-containing protein n=1 Tax=Turnera subulata TaxID=218843 RepID=A0A9Q0FZC9_9ROSI|nr:hypothetical protein Tsubulata_000462 [Turnera subulata]